MGPPWVCGPWGRGGNEAFGDPPSIPPPSFPFQGRIWPLEILHTNKIVTNLHPRWGVSGSGCHGDHLQGPGCLRLSVQPRDQEILSLQLCSCGQASCLWAPCPPPPPGRPLREGMGADTLQHTAEPAVRVGPPAPCGPSGFPRFPRRPRGTAGPSPKHSHHHSVGTACRDGTEQQSPEPPASPSSWGPPGRGPVLDPQGPKGDEMHSGPTELARRQEGRQDHRPDSMPRPALSFTRVTSFRQRPPNTEGHILIPILSTKRSERWGGGRHSSSDPC